jgi:hypothetical protein
MGWRTVLALLVFWVAVFAAPMTMVTLIGAALAVLVLLVVRDQLLALAARWRDDESQPAPIPRDE